MRKLLTILAIGFVMLWSHVPVYAEGTNFELSGITPLRTKEAFVAVDDLFTAGVGTPANNSITSAKIVDGAIVNADINNSAAVAYSKLAPLTATYMLVGNSTNVATAVDITGDIDISNAGAVTISNSAVNNAKVAANAAIDWSKMATSADINTNGTVKGITLGSDAQGDIYYRGATALARLGAGTAGQALVTSGAGGNPYWGVPSVASASNLGNSVVAEAGNSDYTIAFGTAGGAYTLTVPAVGGSRTFSFINEAETISANKTFGQTNLALKGGDANAMTVKVNETLTGAKTLNIKVNDTDRTIDLSGNLVLAGTLTTGGAWTQTGAHTIGITTNGNTTVTLPATGTLATLGGIEAFTGVKTLTTPKIEAGTNDLTITAADQTNATAVATIPDILDAADEFVMKDTAVALTLKTINADSNTISNINADEFDPVALGATAVYGVPFNIVRTVTDLSDAGTNLIQNSAFKFLITGADFINTSAAGGVTSWQIAQGSVGAIGAAITNAVSVANTDALKTSASTFDDGTYIVPSGASGDLVLVGDASGTLDGVVIIHAIRID